MGRTKPTVDPIYARSGKLLGVVCRRDKKSVRAGVVGGGSGRALAGSEISQLGRVSSGRVQKPQKPASGSRSSISGDSSKRGGPLPMPQRSTNRPGGEETGRRQLEQDRDMGSGGQLSEQVSSMPNANLTGGSDGRDTLSMQPKATTLPSSSSTAPPLAHQAGDGTTTVSDSLPVDPTPPNKKKTRLAREIEAHGTPFITERGHPDAVVYVKEYSDLPASAGDRRKWWREDDATERPSWARSERWVIAQ